MLVWVLMLVALAILAFGDRPWHDREEIALLKQEGEKLELRHHVAAGLFYASLINLGLGAAVLFLSRFWDFRQVASKVTVLTRRDRALPARVFWLGLILAVTLAGAVRLNLARGSLWWDELWNLKHTMSGEFRPEKKSGGLKFREVPWEKTVYYYRKPTNHPPMAIASRLSLGAWRKLSGAGRSEFSELALRSPSMLAGLASVAAIAVLLRSWGFAGGGLAAAFLLALHPWHVRYGVDARAYSFAVLWTILGCLWLGKLFRSGGGRWSYWMLFGFNQLMLVWSLPNGIYLAFSFGVAALIFCLRGPPLGGFRAAMFARLVAVNAAAAMVFLFLFLPNALQIAEWGEVNDHHYLSGEVLKNVASQLVFGMEVAWGTGKESEGLASFSQGMASNPLLGWVVMVFLGLAIIAGLLTLQRARPEGGWLLVSILLASALSLLVTWKLHQHFYQRYSVTYLIVPLVALIGIGCVEAPKGLHQLIPRVRWLPLLATLIVLGSYAAFTRPQRVVLSSRSYAPFREVAEYLEREAKLQPINVIGYGLGGRVFLLYYPQAQFCDTLEDLDQLMGDAVQRGGPIYAVFGYQEFNSVDAGSATGAAKLRDEEQFAEVTSFAGIDPLFYFRVLRAKGGAR